MTEKHQKPSERRMSAAAREESRWGLAFVAPPFIGFPAFMAFPIVFAFVASLTKWNGINNMLDNFVGLQNYAKLLTDAKFWKVLGNTIIYMIGIPMRLSAHKILLGALCGMRRGGVPDVLFRHAGVRQSGIKNLAGRVGQSAGAV